MNFYAAGLRIATADSSCCNNYSTVRYFHSDHLGSTRLVTDSFAVVKFADGYQPFGKDNGAPTGSEAHKFTGKPYSQTTGLYYYGARWYDPEIGRFVSQDPFAGHLSDPQTLNPYTYVTNTPTTFTDPTGLDKGLNTDISGKNCGGTCRGDPNVVYALIIFEIVAGGAVICVFACPAIAAYLGIGGAEVAAGASGTSAFACAEECAPAIDTIAVDTAGIGTQELVNTADFLANVEAGTVGIGTQDVISTATFFLRSEVNAGYFTREMLTELKDGFGFPYSQALNVGRTWVGREGAWLSSQNGFRLAANALLNGDQYLVQARYDVGLIEGIGPQTPRIVLEIYLGTRIFGIHLPLI